MAPKVEPRQGGARQQVTGRTVLYAVIAALVTVGPLLGMMGFVLLATVTLLLVASPLLLLFSPVLVPAALLLAGSIASFGAAVAMGFLGAASMMYALRVAGGVVPEGVKRMFGVGEDFGGYLKEKGERYQPHLVTM